MSNILSVNGMKNGHLDTPGNCLRCQAFRLTRPFCPHCSHVLAGKVLDDNATVCEVCEATLYLPAEKKRKKHDE